MTPAPRCVLKVLAASAVLTVPSLAQACPRCINSSPNHVGLIVGVIFLLPLPFIIMGSIAWRLYKARHHAPD